MGPLVQAPCEVNSDVVALGVGPRSVEMWRVANHDLCFAKVKSLAWSKFKEKERV